MVDKFKFHVSHEDKMSTIYAEGKSNQLVDVLPNKQYEKLETCFKNYSQKSLDHVKFLVTDMNTTDFMSLTI